MDAKILYKTLEKDFIKKGLSDDWSRVFSGIEDVIDEEYKKRWMGVVCNFSENIIKVYTAVFPSKKVMQEIIDKNETDAMLFVHHPAGWNLINDSTPWINMDKKLLRKFKERRISIYNLHVPLDNFGEYSTSYTLSKALGMEVVKPISPYFGSMAGVLCTTNLGLKELEEQFGKVVNHKVKLYKYGADEITKVAVLAGGGNVLEEYAGFEQNGANILVTGVTVNNKHSRYAHAEAKKRKINILGGTHYSTEKFACMSMVYYFKKLGLQSEFLTDKPCMGDL